MTRSLLIGLLSIAAICLFGRALGASMLQNGDFAEGLAGWTNVESGQKVSVEKSGDRPALRVEVVKDNGTQLGEIRQSVAVQQNRNCHWQ